MFLFDPTTFVCIRLVYVRFSVIKYSLFSPKINVYSDFDEYKDSDLLAVQYTSVWVMILLFVL